MVRGGDEPADVLSRRRNRRLHQHARDIPPRDESQRASMTDLGGKVAVVTGASRGLGQRAAIRLAGHGAVVVLIARSEAALGATAPSIIERGGGAEIVRAVVSDPRSLSAVPARTSRMGAPSILV